MFQENDKDLDGKLSWEEFCGEQTKTEKAFFMMDMDKNGKVSKEVELIFITLDMLQTFSFRNLDHFVKHCQQSKLRLHSRSLTSPEMRSWTIKSSVD